LVDDPQGDGGGLGGLAAEAVEEVVDFIGIRSSLGYAIPFRLLRGALAC
jgi:hypothetical protein